MAVIHFFPLRWSAEKDAGKRLLGQIIKLCSASIFAVLIKGGRKIGGLFRQNEQLWMALEQRDEQGRSGFGLASGKTGALLKWQNHCCWCETIQRTLANHHAALLSDYN